MVARLADLCDELAKAVTGLLGQDNAATAMSESLRSLDRLIKSARGIVDSPAAGRKRQASSERPQAVVKVAKKRVIGPRSAGRKQSAIGVPVNVQQVKNCLCNHLK